MSTTYHCEGDVRGDCGHRHRTYEAAAECLRRDEIGCRSQGGYSDRRIVDSDGRVIRDEDWTGALCATAPAIEAALDRCDSVAIEIVGGAIVEPVAAYGEHFRLAFAPLPDVLAWWLLAPCDDPLVRYLRLVAGSTTQPPRLPSSSRKERQQRAQSGLVAWLREARAKGLRETNGRGRLFLADEGVAGYYASREEAAAAAAAAAAVTPKAYRYHVALRTRLQGGYYSGPRAWAVWRERSTGTVVRDAREIAAALAGKEGA